MFKQPKMYFLFSGSKKTYIFFFAGSPAASPESSDNSDTHHSGGSDMEMDEPIMGSGKRGQQRLSDTEVSHTYTHISIPYITDLFMVVTNFESTTNVT